MLNFWIVRFGTLLLWVLAAASSVFWVLQSMNPRDVMAASSGGAIFPQSVASASLEGDLAPQIALTLGAKQMAKATPAVARAALLARFQLLGIVKSGSKSGAALIALDGKPPKPYKVGAVIEDDLKVLLVEPRSVSLGASIDTAITLELPLKK